MTLRNLYLLSMIIFAAFILFLSIIPDVGGGVNSGISAHIIAYFTLSISTSLFIKADNYHYPLLKGAILAGTYGAIIEIVQNFIPYRRFELLDILLNYSGAFAAIIPLYIATKKRCH